MAALGTLKLGAVFCPLFSAFGPEPIRARMTIGRARVLLTTPTLYRRKVADQRRLLPDLEHVLLVADHGEATSEPGTRDYGALMAAAPDAFTIAPTNPEDPALLHFTSGTTGKPKGALHVHAAVVAHHATGKLALDLHPEDVFWCTADPGWVTGTSYGIVAPLTNGVTSIVDEAEFEVERWYRLLQDQRVTVWYTAPTAIRMLMKAGTELAHKYELGALRFLASVGEPLNPEAVVWGNEAFGLPFHDNWWQTETGGIMIANFATMDIRPGSMGRPLPGVEAAIVRKTGPDAVEVIEEPDVQGELALRPGWPSMFRAYLDEPERYRKCFVGGFYLTGDLARRDRDAVSRLPRSIAERQRRRTEERLRAAGLSASIAVEEDQGALGPGTVLFLAVRGRAGFSSLGRRGLPAEHVADAAVDELLAWAATGAAIDEHLADQLVPFLVLGRSGSTFTCPRLTPHLNTVAWVVRHFVAANVALEEGPPARVRIDPVAR